MTNQVTTLKMGLRFKQTPAGEIPVDWDCRRLGDVAQFINGHGFKPSDWKTSGMPIVRIQNLNGSSTYNYFQGQFEEEWQISPGELLFSWSGSRGTSFGPHIWKGPQALLNQHIFKVRSSNAVHRSFLYQVLRQITVSIEQRAHGSAGLVHITKGGLEDFFVPVPPAGEQHKIAEMLSSLDNVLEATKKEGEAHQEFRRQLTHKLMSKSIKKWKRGQLRNLLLEPIRNGYSPICPSQPTGRWTLELGALSADGFRSDKAKPAPTDDLKADSALLKRGDLLVSRSNTRNLVGLASIYNGQPDNCIFPDLMMRVCLSTTTMIPEFLETYLVSPFGRRYFEAHARGTSGSMVKINAAILGDMPIPMPPLDEQTRIVAGLRKARDLIAVSETSGQTLINLRHGLMRELLTGLKRVIP